MQDKLYVNYSEIESYIADVREIAESMNIAYTDALDLYQAFSDTTNPVYRGQASVNLIEYFDSLKSHCLSLITLTGALAQYLNTYEQEMKEDDQFIAETLRIQ